MPKSQWSLQDAKNRVSAVAEAARSGTPQVVTKHGKRAVVVISVEEYDRLDHLRRAELPSFVDHLLAMPTDDGAFERLDLDPRAIDL